MVKWRALCGWVGVKGMGFNYQYKAAHVLLIVNT